MKNTTNLLQNAGNPGRLQLLIQLAKAGEQSVIELYTAIGMSQAVASGHLIRLKERGILVSRKDGVRMYYSIAPKMQNAIQQLVQIWEELK
jgi:DNA-binding transcriptional ArsR family regulator